MSRLFIGLNAANMLVLTSVVSLGFLASGTIGNGSGSHTSHIVLGIFAGMLAVFVHLTTLTYFMATSKWLVAAANKANLDPQQFVATATNQKRRVFKFCMVAVITTMLALFSGAGSDPTFDPMWPAAFHLWFVFIALVANLLCAVALYGDVKARGYLMDQALGILNKSSAIVFAMWLVIMASCSRAELDSDPEEVSDNGKTSIAQLFMETSQPVGQAPQPAPVLNDVQLFVPLGAGPMVMLPAPPEQKLTGPSAPSIPMPIADVDEDKVVPQPATIQTVAGQVATAHSVMSLSARGSPPATPLDPDITLVKRWLGQIELKHKRIKSLTAGLTYDRNNLALGDRQRRLGTLVYLAGPPPKFAIHLDHIIVNKGKRKLDHWYIFDGRYLVERINNRKQFIRRELQPDEKGKHGQMLAIGASPFVVPLPLRKKDLMDRFFIKLIPTVDNDPPNTIHFQLTPKPTHHVQFKRIEIWHDRATLLPAKVLTFDKSQYESEIWIKAPVVNKPVNESLIDTRPPIELGWRVEDTVFNP